MNIVFVSSGIYPDQHAAAIRHSTIAQGFVENGHQVEFFLLSAQPWKRDEINYKGVIIKSLNNYQGKNKVKKLYSYLRAIYNLRERILDINNSNKIDGIVVFSIDVVAIKALISLAKRYKIKIFHERTELPYIVGKENSIVSDLTYNYYIKNLIPKFDGIFVISDKLKDYFISYNRNIEKILTVVDTTFFKSITSRMYQFQYIAYCGNLGSKKDGIPLLIESFAKLSTNFPQYKLLLIGQNTNRMEINEVFNAIKKFNIENKVVFTGFVNRNDMPNLLGHADLLVISKPENEQNSGNFPIKIGEYLATGKPIVATKVGEIPKFIVDGESGFLAIPNSSESFYHKMEEALTDYKKSIQIGSNGKKIAEQVFDYKVQAKKMAAYINKIELSYGN